jgi:uncharacterized protein
MSESDLNQPGSNQPDSKQRGSNQPGSQEEPPKIEFPCAYPIKVMGEKCEEFRSHVMVVMGRHAPGFDELAVTVRDSSKGKYQSLTVTITATGEEQLKAIFVDLKTSSLVQMVL